MARVTTARIGIAFAALLCVHLAQGVRAETLTLRYGQAYSAARSIFSLPVAVAEREGFFAREGLKVEILQPIPGGADHQITALHNDSVDLTHVATPFLIRAALGGSDAVAIASEFNNPIYSLIAKPEIATVAALRGKLIALADEYGTITLSTRKLLALHGVQRGEFGARIIGHVGAVGVSAPRRLRRGRAGTAAGPDRNGAGLSAARRLDRSRAGPALHRHRRPAVVGGGQQGGRNPLRARTGRVVRLHPRAREPRARRAHRHAEHELLGGNRGAHARAVLRAGARRATQARRDRSHGARPGDRDAGGGGRAQGAAAIARAVRGPAISARRRRAIVKLRKRTPCCLTNFRSSSRSPWSPSGYFHFWCWRPLHATGSCGSPRSFAHGRPSCSLRRPSSC